MQIATTPVPHPGIDDASKLLKVMAHPDRLTVLYLLFGSERSFEELCGHTGLPSHVLSNHLTRMRQNGLIDFTRFHRIIQYRIVSDEVIELLTLLRRRHFPEA